MGAVRTSSAVRGVREVLAFDVAQVQGAVQWAAQELGECSLSDVAHVQ